MIEIDNVWLYSLASVFIVSIISFVGVFALAIKDKTLNRFLLFLISFSAGALFGDAVIHLLPEAVEEFGFGLGVSLSFLSGILAFFILEKFMHWRHCHIPTSKQHPHPLAAMNLIGDGFHNIIDGMVIGGSYIVSIPLGIATTIAVILHEIPQEIGDFGVLIYAGISKIKALFFNFLSALTAFLGVVIALTVGAKTQNFALFILPFTAGGFIYIAGSDLIPELHKETIIKKSALQLFAIICGIALMVAMVLLE